MDALIATAKFINSEILSKGGNATPIDTLIKALQASFADVHTLVDSASKGYANYEIISTSKTWAKPSGVNRVLAIVIGGGGGGGGGGYPADSNNAGGGGGGGSGYINSRFVDVSNVSSVIVTIGSGGNGGAKITSYANGTTGSTGGTTSFGSYLSSPGGGSGSGGRPYQTETGGNGIGFNPGSGRANMIGDVGMTALGIPISGINVSSIASTSAGLSGGRGFSFFGSVEYGAGGDGGTGGTTSNGTPGGAGAKGASGAVILLY